MIENNTVFILGAGAHCSYDFPSGKTLKEKIAEKIKRWAENQGSPADSLTRLINRGLLKPEENSLDNLENFAKSLSLAGQGSIDAFLEANKNQNGFQTIGKAAIAQILLSCEAMSSFTSNDDWLSYLFGMLIDGANTPEKFVENKISFITFNYDRYLEMWLFMKISHSFGISEQKAEEIFKKIPIIHMYGSLGMWPKNTNTSLENYQDAWVEATKNIRTIYETQSEHTEINQAKKLLENAHTVCLLGFGFHMENIEILDLPKYLEKCKLVGSSRFEITDSEWVRFTRKLPQEKIHKVHDYKYKCLDTLRHLPIFF